MKKRDLYEGAQRTRILAAMVTNRAVCSRIASQWVPEGLFDTDWSNLVGGWCVKHLRQYGEPIGLRLQSRFEEYVTSNGHMSEEVIARIEFFLTSLSDFDKEDDEYTDEYLIDLAGKFFNRTRFHNEVSAAKLELERGRHQDAEERLMKLRRVELGVGSYVEPGEDFDLWEQAFHTSRVRPLVRYRGAAGEYFAESFLRGEFYAFLAPEKRGKTSYLIDFTMRALQCRNHVAYFECGDGDRDEVLVRLGCCILKQPQFSGTYGVPISWNDNGDPVIEQQKMTGAHPIDAYRAFDRCTKNSKVFRLSAHPNRSINVEGIDGCLADWELEDWRADVVVIDYADILAAPKGEQDKIKQISETWAQLRRLSQRRHCLVVTATQANAKSYGNREGFMGPENFSGSKEKNAHVNGIIGINVSDEEYHKGMARLCWTVKRQARVKKPRRFVTIAGCFGTDSPVILSRW